MYLEKTAGNDFQFSTTVWSCR